MARFKLITVADAKARIDSGEALVVDVRDPESYATGHIPSACHLTNDNVDSFLATTDRARPVIVCCYRGHSSRDVARFLAERDFVEVYSLEGGFDRWRAEHPELCLPSTDATQPR
jgi:thiosulfate sulfurtransferase